VACFSLIGRDGCKVGLPDGSGPDSTRIARVNRDLPRPFMEIKSMIFNSQSNRLK
jgi:hypothetical protein